MKHNLNLVGMRIVSTVKSARGLSPSGRTIVLDPGLQPEVGAELRGVTSSEKNPKFVKHYRI